MMPFKMASLTGTSNRNAFLVTVVALLVAVPLILVTKTWIGSMFGFDRVETHVTCDVATICSVVTVGTASLPMIVGPAAIGFVITLVLALTHARFVWFPFEPLGFLIATSIAGTWWGVWDAFLGAWLIKTIVLRVGGSKLYERCIPIVGGFVVAVVMTIFVGSLVLAVRFFIPF
jgi:hypothetical protein